MPQIDTGLIRVDEAYSKQMVLQRLGISQKFWVNCSGGGLPYTNVAHSRWVTGRALIEHLASERREETRMQPTPKLKPNRRLPCREGPKLATFNSIRTGRSKRPTATALPSNSIARSVRHASARTAALVIDAKHGGSCGNANSDCSTETTSVRAVPSPPSTKSTSCRLQCKLFFPVPSNQIRSRSDLGGVLSEVPLVQVTADTKKIVRALGLAAQCRRTNLSGRHG